MKVMVEPVRGWVSTMALVQEGEGEQEMCCSVEASLNDRSRRRSRLGIQLSVSPPPRQRNTWRSHSGG